MTNRSTQRFHRQADKWFTANHGQVVPSTNEEWTLLLQEDSQHPYSEYPITNPPALIEDDGLYQGLIDQQGGMTSPYEHLRSSVSPQPQEGNGGDNPSETSMGSEDFERAKL